MIDLAAGSAGCVLLTEHPWPNREIEESVLEAAGYRLLIAPEVAGMAAEVEAPVESCSLAAITTCWAPASRRAIELAVASNTPLQLIDSPHRRK